MDVNEEIYVYIMSEKINWLKRKLSVICNDPNTV